MPFFAAGTCLSNDYISFLVA